VYSILFWTNRFFLSFSLFSLSLLLLSLINMSLNRQRPRTRVNSRANTLPSLSNITVNTDTTSTSATTMDTSNSAFLPSIEESLQDWLSRSIPDTPSSTVSWLLDTCRCCNQNDCENLETIASTIRKLENDARLAAGISFYSMLPLKISPLRL